MNETDGFETTDAPGMSDEYRARMRRGLSSLVVHERLRERRKKRAIAGAALAVAAVAVVGVVGAQALGPTLAERLEAQQPPASTSPSASAEPADPTRSATPSQTPTPSPVPSQPEYPDVAAREAQEIEFEAFDCDADGCGDAGAAGSRQEEGLLDAYVVCGPEGLGRVFYGGQLWVDCAVAGAETGVAQLSISDTVLDGDPELSVSPDFDGQTALVPSGETPQGVLPVSSVTVFVECSQSTAVSVGGVEFACGSDPQADGKIFTRASYAAWGVPVPTGALAPEVVGAAYETQIRFRFER